MTAKPAMHQQLPAIGPVDDASIVQARSGQSRSRSNDNARPQQTDQRNTGYP